MLLACLISSLLYQPAHAQIRIASYNVYNNPDNTSEDNSMRLVFQGIADQEANGIAKPIDIMTLHEIDTAGVSRIPSLLSQVNPDGNYQIAYTSSVGGDRNAIVYDANTVQLVDSGITTIVTAGPRDILRAEFRPVGYSSSDADFFLYSLHLKASSSYAGTRNSELTTVRANSDALGSVNAIYAGDFNFYSTSESGYRTIRASGNGQGFDPVVNLGYRMPGTIDASYPSSGRRFDFQFITDELSDSEGIDMIPESYRIFYGDGDTISDHRPTVADYQLPAVMDASLSLIESTFRLDESAEAILSVENIADVLAAMGADELDYTVSVTGDLLGEYTNTVQALDGPDLHSIVLDTSTPGEKSGTVFVEASSFAAENISYSFPVNFVVEVPEPSTLIMLMLGLAVVLTRCCCVKPKQ